MLKTIHSRVFFILLLIGLLYFLAFVPINRQGVRDSYMISVFEPDEFAQYPHPIRMLNQPGGSIRESIYRFTAYQHYYYGYPFYLFSAVGALLPLKLLGLVSPQNMLLLYRQIVGILPMIAALMLLVHVQTKFRSYARSLLLFVFLLTVPIVFENNTWWHPDSLVFFFVALTFWLLDADHLSFGRYFYFAAGACGLAVATKLVGLFFVVAIPVYILIGWRSGKLTLGGAFKVSVGFVALMAITFLASSPFLLFRSEREAAFKIQSAQAEAMTAGFVLAYEKGPATWIPVLTESFGQPLFLLLAVASLGFGIANREKRLPNLLILTWALPFALYLLFFVAVKSKHYFLPVLLPVFSALPHVYEYYSFSGMGSLAGKNLVRTAVFALAVVVGISQVFYNINFDARVYSAGIRKEADSPALQFFTELDSRYLSHIPPDRQIEFYRDVRMYVADRPGWKVRHRWGTTDYAYIEKNNPDVLVLWKQRLYDFTNEGALERALDSAEVAEAARFYRDALEGAVHGYQLIHQDEFGMAYLRNDLYQTYFK